MSTHDNRASAAGNPPATRKREYQAMGLSRFGRPRGALRRLGSLLAAGALLFLKVDGGKQQGGTRVADDSRAAAGQRVESAALFPAVFSGRVQQMGRAYQNRKESMAKTSAMKSKIYGKYGREIYVVAKSGGTDPAGNLTLRSLLQNGRIERKLSATLEGIAWEEFRADGLPARFADKVRVLLGL